MLLTLINRKWHNEDTYSLMFKRDKNIDFKPGQFFTMRVPVNEKIESRAYSISSSPTEKGFFMFTIKKEGLVSNRLSEIKKNENLEVKGPFGLFTLDEKHKNIVFIAGGTGIAPFRSMVKFILDKNLDTKIKLFYSVRKEEDILFRDEFYRLVKTNKNFNFIPMTTRDENFKGYKGRISDRLLRNNINNFEDNLFYLCGPKGFVDFVNELLKKSNVNPAKIKIEKWG